MTFPRDVRIGTFQNGDPILVTVNNEEEYENLLLEIEAGQDYVRSYFDQYWD